MVHRGVLASQEKKPRSSAPPLRKAPHTRATKQAAPNSAKLSGTLNALAAQPSSTRKPSKSGAQAAAPAPSTPQQAKPVPAKRLRSDAVQCVHDDDEENKKPRRQEPLESSAPAHRAALLMLQQSCASPAPSEPELGRESALEGCVEAHQRGMGASTGLEPLRQLETAGKPLQPFQPLRRDHIALVHSALLGSASSMDTCIPSFSQSSLSCSSDLSSQGKEQPEGGDCTSTGGDSMQQCHFGAPFGREQHFADLHKLLRKCCHERSGRSVYISGLPGTGKSHTVRAVLDSLKEQQQGTQQQICPVFLSCFSLRDPSDVHRALHAACKLSISGMAAAPLQASSSPQYAHQQLLDLLQSWSKQASGKRGLKGRNKMCVLVLDEVDQLLLKGTEDMYKLFMLPQAAGVQCCLVAMANSIDITERSLPALKCRGCTPVFMPFTAYSRPQVLSILSSKLSSLPWPVFQEHALELVARKVSSSSGDLRKVFQACRFALGNLHDRAVKSMEQEQRDTGLQDVNRPASADQVQQAQEQAGRNSGTQTAAAVMVNVSDMAAALARLNYQSGSGASSVSTIRGLPQQQQLHLLALATSVATAATQAAADAEAEAAAQQHGLTTSAYRTKYYWGPSALGPKPLKSSNPFATDVQRSAMQHSSSSGPGAAILGGGLQGSMHSTAGCMPQGSGAAAVTQKEFSGRQPQGESQATEAEVGSARHAQAGQGNESKGAEGGGAASLPTSMSRRCSTGSSSSNSGRTSLFAGDAARTVPLSAAYEQFRRMAVQMYQHPASEQEFRSTMQLLSHTGLVGMDAAGFSRMSAKGGGAGKAKEGGAALSLKVQMKDIQAAFRDNVLFKRVLSDLPAV